MTGACHVAGRVSRKKEFVPPITAAVVEKGWQPPAAGAEEPADEDASKQARSPSVLFVDPDDPHGRPQRRRV